MDKNYTIGLDIGTSSVGWAVIDDEYKIIKKGKHPLWGVRLFDEANTAADRRLKRNIRRRFARRRERIELLREEFAEYIDDDFFEMLDDSFYVNYDEKKRHKIDDKFKKNASDYYKKYPTIYHLRNELVTNSEKVDIRLVYLALHHIIKYRGNFLKEGKKFSVSDININIDFINLIESVNSCESLGLLFESYEDIDFEEIMKIHNNKDKEKKLNSLFSDLIVSDLGIDTKPFYSTLSKLLVGYKGDLFKMFNVEPEDDVSLSISFNGDDYDKNIDNIDKFFADFVEVIDAIKVLFDDIYLKNIFNKENVNSISTLMISKFKDHRDDLDLLKKVFRNNAETRCLFKGKNKDTKRTGIYGNYLSKKITYDDFIKEIKKLSEKLNDDDKYIYDVELLPRLDSGDFMPLVSSIENGKYPYQLNLDELIKIIENQGKYYPFLLEKCGDVYRIQKILEFKIPYYVGPLGNDHGKNYNNHWLIRNEGYENIKVTPYNFDDVVNRNDTAEQFIMRMVSNCTYLLDEKAMPADSILYSEFKVLNELKQIKIGGVPLDVANISFIVENFFKKSNKNTDKAFKLFLLENRDRFNYENGIEITGYSASNGFANSMKSYIDFFGDDGIFSGTTYKINDADQIIEWVTIFEDKTILKEKINNSYYDLSDNVVRKICSLKYSGWSSLSKKLLTQISCYDKDLKINSSIIDIMRNTSKNFMQIISRKEFKNEIAKLNSLSLSGKTSLDEVVYELSTSPANKRGILQAIKIVNAIKKKMGYDPSKICIEMARGEGVKERTAKRKDKIDSLYKTFKVNTIDSLDKVKKEIKNFENDDLKNKALFLYFMQCGKCMYCGRDLDVSNLDNMCDIDHIIPQSLFKDDSFDNTVLVCKGCNSIKSGSNVVPKNFRDNMKPLWEVLRNNGNITVKKFDRLSREFYKDSDIQGFVNRQLVETRQVTKHVANILNSIYPDTDVIYLHADLTSNYRKRYELYKFRDLNDLHHAHDAYLAAVLGVYKKKYFDFDDKEYRINFRNKSLQVSELFKNLNNQGKNHNMRYGYIINSLDSEYGYIYSNCSSDEINLIISSIDYNLYRNDILVSYKQFEHNGRLYKETIHSHNEVSSSKIPIKKDLNPELYGFYSDAENSFFVLLNVKNKTRVVPVPYYKSLNHNDLIDYVSNLLSLDKNNVNIYRILKKNSLVLYQNQLCLLSGGRKSMVEVKNAVQLKLPADYLRNNGYILNYILNRKLSQNDVLCDEDLDNFRSVLFNSINHFPLLLDVVTKYYNEYDFEWDIDKKSDYLFDFIKLLNSGSSYSSNIVKVSSRCADRSLLDVSIADTDILGLNKKITIIKVDD